MGDTGRAQLATLRFRPQISDETYERLQAADPGELTPEELDALADAAWWRCFTRDSIAARQRAYTRYVEAGAYRKAAGAATNLFYENLYEGDLAVSLGWLRRARRHLTGEAESSELGFVASAESELALQRGALVDAETAARRAVEIGRRCSDTDVEALALQLEGRALIAQGNVYEGSALLDEAMCLVLAGQVGEFMTGAIYCAVMHVCRDLADLRRAGEWTNAAREWCDALPYHTPFHGICRVYRGEVIALRGAWEEAEAELRTACDELFRFRPTSASEAFYAIGELQRRRGDLAAAEDAFARARELGRDPQPGLALVRLAQGRTGAAAASLRTALAVAHDPVARARLLGARVEVALANDSLDDASASCEELSEIAEQLGSVAVGAAASGARGALRLAEGDAGAALLDLRGAATIWRDLGLPFEEAQARALAGAAARSLGDEEGGRSEIDAAKRIFERLGVVGDGARAPLARKDAASRKGLSEREKEVLRLIAGGKNTRAIAETLVISEHTVARHVQNIFSKLDVSSRAAAIAAAFEHDLV